MPHTMPLLGTLPDITPWEWAVFGSLVLIMLLIDLWSHRGERGESHGWAIAWSVIWVAAGLGFALFVWFRLDAEEAQKYLAAYLIEKSLSLDNLFVFLIIFKTLHIHKEHQRTALFWGIFGALVFRAIFIYLGAQALETERIGGIVEWVFAGILLYAAIHAFREDPAEQKENKLVKWLARHFPVAEEYGHTHFVVKRNNRWKATPLLIAVLGLEMTDVVFAIDSVPAAFSVIRRPGQPIGAEDVFIVYSSNVFAILGLRSLYIVLAKTISDLRYLHYGLAAVLVFAAVKMVLPEGYHIHPLISVGIIVALIGAAIIASLLARPEVKGGPAGDEPVEQEAHDQELKANE